MGFAGSTFTAPASIDGAIMHLENHLDSEPGDFQELINITAASDELIRIYKVTIDCRAESRALILVNSVAYGSVRTGPASPLGVYDFYLPLTVSPGQTFTVLFEQASDTPSMDIACYAQVTLKQV